MKDFERIDAFEKEMRYLHQKFSIVFKKMDDEAFLTNAILKTAESILAQNQRLIKELEKKV